MDVTQIAATASALSAEQRQHAVSAAVLRKTQDVEIAAANALLQALPAAPQAVLPPHLGRHINTTA